MSDHIFYKEGIKYVLTRDYSIATGLTPPFAIVTEQGQFDEDGTITIYKGFPWDGPSGPTYDSLDAIRASLVHDFLYGLLRAGLLNAEFYREQADRLFRDICLEDGMWSVRADTWYEALRLGAGPAADPKNEKKELTAP